MVAPLGEHPSYASNGKHIVYTDGNNLFVVAVDSDGASGGAPVQLTFDGAGTINGQPSWSNHDKTIVFHSNRGGDFDLWTTPAAGDSPTRLTGQAGEGDFDPAYSKNGQQIAYAAIAPPAPTLVRVTLYDVRGWQVHQLVAGERAAGIHKIRFDASHLPSGTYFYHIEAGNLQTTKQIFLLK